MKKQYLTLEQNLYGARIFLNLFNLFIDIPIKDINIFTKIKIYNEKNINLGEIYFEDGKVKINCQTKLGILTAEYNFGTFNCLEDLECGGAYIEWFHNINFQVEGEQPFNGELQINASVDTEFGINCNAHAKMNYIDKDNKEVCLDFMEDGKPFRYEAKKDNFEEVLEINPWDDFWSYMYHRVRNGEYDDNIYGYQNDNTKFVWNNGENDEEHLIVVSNVIENSLPIESKEQLYERLGQDDSIECTIQKGTLMHQIDPSFSKKINELIELFKKDETSFISNLINMTFNKVSEEEINALFGTNIEKIIYYNNSNNLLEAYFKTNENNLIKSKDMLIKTLKRQ